MVRSGFLLSICLDAFRVMQKKRRFRQSGEALSLYEMHITKFCFENFKLCTLDRIPQIRRQSTDIGT